MAQPQITNAITEAQGGAQDVGFPPFKTETYAGQLFWLVLSFGALYYLMARVVLPRLSGIIETRRRTIAADLDEAAAMKTRAEEAGSSYEKALSEARARAQGLARDNSARLAAETEARRKALEAELNERLAAADASIAATKAQAMGNVRGIAADTAQAIVERLTGQPVDRAEIEAAVDRNAA